MKQLSRLSRYDIWTLAYATDSDGVLSSPARLLTTLWQFMFTCSSEVSGYPFESLAPSGELVCRIPELSLAPGRYVFNLFSTIGVRLPIGYNRQAILMWPQAIILAQNN